MVKQAKDVIKSPSLVGIIIPISPERKLRLRTVNNLLRHTVQNCRTGLVRLSYCPTEMLPIVNCLFFFFCNNIANACKCRSFKDQVGLIAVLPGEARCLIFPHQRRASFLSLGLSPGHQTGNPNTN